MSNTGSIKLCLCLVAVLHIARAQGTGTISGTVIDESAAVIPNAAVSIVNKSTGATRNVTTNAEGIFSAPSLQAGDYELRAEVRGFRTMVRDATVQAGNATTV